MSISDPLPLCNLDVPARAIHELPNEMAIYTVGLSDSTEVVENQSDEEDELDILKKELLKVLEEMQDEMGSDDDAGPE